MAVKAQDPHALRAVSTAVDATFYRTVYPDIAAGGIDPLQHYLLAGWREGRDPAPWFSTRAYLAANGDVAKAGVEPLGHFLTQGAREGRDTAPSEHAEAYLDRNQGWAAGWTFEALAAGRAGPGGGDAVAADIAVVAPEFDAAFYLARNPDIAQAGLDPIRHFVERGWRDGRDPRPDFSLAAYLDAHPDAATKGINPFVHWIKAGRPEGRAPRDELGFRYEIIARSASPQDRLDRALDVSQTAWAGSVEGLVAALGAAQSGLPRLHVTFSDDDYVDSNRGLELSLRRESAGFEAKGFDHLHLFPVMPWPVTRRAGEPGPLGVLLNGSRLGSYRAADVKKALAAVAGPAEQRSFAIHSLVGHAPEETVAILGALGLTKGWFWLHDFASLCAGVHLLRNDVEDCAAPPPKSAACSICAYGSLRRRHLDAHRALFRRLELTVVAPSEATLAFWRSRTGLEPAGEVVLPLARLIDRKAAPVTPGGPLRVAFVGMPLPTKDWPLFRELAERFAGDPRYEFHHLGGRADPDAPVIFHEVVAGPGRSAAVQEALEAIEADVAMIWPLCRETFSFTAYDAAAAGAAVITGPDSGHVAAFVAETGFGRVLDSEAALFEAFETGGVLDLARRIRRPRLHDLAFSALTADLAELGA